MCLEIEKQPSPWWEPQCMKSHVAMRDWSYSWKSSWGQVCPYYNRRRGRGIRWIDGLLDTTYISISYFYFIYYVDQAALFSHCSGYCCSWWLSEWMHSPFYKHLRYRTGLIKVGTGQLPTADGWFCLSSWAMCLGSSFMDLCSWTYTLAVNKMLSKYRPRKES